MDMGYDNRRVCAECADRDVIPVTPLLRWRCFASAGSSVSGSTPT